MSCLHLTCRAYWPNFSSFSNEGCCGERCLCAYTSFDVYAFKLDSFWSLLSVRDNTSIMLQFPGNDAQLLYCITSIQAKKFIFLPICWIITHCAFFFLSLWKDFHNKSAFGTNVWCMSAELRWTMAGDRDRISLIPINILFFVFGGFS